MMALSVYIVCYTYVYLDKKDPNAKTHIHAQTHTNGDGLCQGCHQTSNSQLGKDIAKVVIKTSSSQLGKDIAKDVIKYPVVSWWDIQ